MKPFFCRVGGKSPIANKIIKMIPEHKIYIEPFIGGGAILFAKQPSKIEVINDLDKKLISGYRLLKKITINDINEIINFMKKFKGLSDDKKIELLNKFMNIKVSNNGLKLYQVLIQMCGTFSSTGRGKIYKPQIQNQKINKIQEYKDRLKKVKIYSTDYKNIIEKFDSSLSFFFLDPPYENSDTLYKNDTIDYQEMADTLSNINGKFLLTLNDSDNIKNIFRQFNIKKINVKGRSREGADIGGEIRKELIITNY